MKATRFTEITHVCGTGSFSLTIAAVNSPFDDPLNIGWHSRKEIVASDVFQIVDARYVGPPGLVCRRLIIRNVDGNNSGVGGDAGGIIGAGR